MTIEELARQVLDEILAEEEAKLTGPECAPGTHTVQQRTLASGVLDPAWGHCTTCERTVNREWTPDWVVYHGSGCQCRECRAHRTPTPTEKD